MTKYGLILPCNSLHVLAEMLPPLPVLKLVAGANRGEPVGSKTVGKEFGFYLTQQFRQRLFIKYHANGEIKHLKDFMFPLKMAGFPDAKISQVDFGVKDEDNASHCVSFLRDTIHVKYFDDMMKRKDQPAPFRKLIERMEKFKVDAAERLNLSSRQMSGLKPSPMFTFKLNPTFEEHAERLAYVNNHYLPCAIMIQKSIKQFGLVYYEPKDVESCYV